MTTKFDIIKQKSLAAMGNVEAMFLLACNYLYGVGVEIDVKKAHSYFHKSSQKGFVPARELIESIFADKGESTEFNPEFTEFYNHLRTIYQNADQGIPEALFLKSIGKMSDDTNDYMFMRGVKDMSLACKQGYAPALHSLGIVYYNGNRIVGRQEDGIQMILQSAEKEYVPAIRTLMEFAPEKAYPIINRLAQIDTPDGEVLFMLSQYYMHGVILEEDITEGLRLLEEAAKKNSGGAMFNLGVIYEFGQYGVERNIQNAVKYYEQGCEEEDIECMVNLGCILEESEEYPHDYTRAFELYSKAAEKGSGRAYNNLGSCYKRAIGTVQDPQKAVDCYEKAIKNDCPEAYWNLYLYYMDDVCTPRNFTKAVEWLKKGDQAGISQCTYQLTKYYRPVDGIERDAKKYFECLYRASMQGFEEAYNELGDCFKYGVGTEKDGSSAFEWYQKAASISVEGIWNLATCYTYAIGTEKNDKMAVELYKIAAEQGYAPAQYDLGICYRQGEGVEKDPLTAISWYIKAAEQGHGGAMNNLGIMYDNGIGVDINHEKAFQYFKGSAETGNMEGQFCLADMYFDGRGVEQNYEEAVKWFKKAAEQGEPDSMYHLAICYNEGLGVEINQNLVAHYLYEAANRGFKQAIDVINDNRISPPQRTPNR